MSQFLKVFHANVDRFLPFALGFCLSAPAAPAFSPGEALSSLYFEEPVRGKQTPFLQRFTPCPNVEVLRPHTTVDAVGFHDDQLPELKPLLAEYLSDFSIDDYLVWFYTPMALPLLAELKPRAVIYDCMDELSAFKGAPRQMVQRESALMKRAQLVLTGGPSLYEAKRALHNNVHCFPSAVDADHFSARSVAQCASGGVSSPHVIDAVVHRHSATERKPSRFEGDAERLHSESLIRVWASLASSTSASMRNCWLLSRTPLRLAVGDGRPGR